MNANNRKIARNAILLYIRMAFVLLLSLVTTRVVLKALGVEDYGTYNVVCGFVALFGVFNACFATTINRFYNFELGKKNPDGVAVVYRTSLVIQGILALVLFILLELIGLYYLNTKMVLPEGRLFVSNCIFQLSVISLIFTILQAPYAAAVMAYERMDYYAIVSVIDAIMKVLFAVSLYYASYDRLLLYGASMCFISIANFFMYFIYSRRKIHALWKNISFDKATFKSMLSFSGWSVLDPLSYITRDQGTNMVLNSFFGTAVNAAQGIAYQVSAAVDSFGNSLSTSFRPQIIQSYSEGNHTRTNYLMYSMSKLNFMLQAMLVLPICFEIDYVLKLWLGENIPQFTSVFAILVLVSKTINTLNAPITQVMIATGKIKVIRLCTFFIITMIVPISILLYTLGYPAWSAYIVLIVLTIINQIAAVCILKKTFVEFSYRDYIHSIIIPCLTYVVIVSIAPLCITYLMDVSVIRLITTVFFSLLISLLVGYYIVLNKKEREFFTNLIHSKLKI